MKSVSRGGFASAGAASRSRSEGEGARHRRPRQCSARCRCLGGAFPPTAPTPTVTDRSARCSRRDSGSSTGTPTRWGSCTTRTTSATSSTPGTSSSAPTAAATGRSRPRASSLPVVEAHVPLRAPARYDDLLLVGTEVPAVTRVTLTFGYQVTPGGRARGALHRATPSMPALGRPAGRRACRSGWPSSSRRPPPDGRSAPGSASRERRNRRLPRRAGVRSGPTGEEDVHGPQPGAGGGARHRAGGDRRAPG